MVRMDLGESAEAFEDRCRVLLSEAGELDRFCSVDGSLGPADEAIVERCLETIALAAEHGVDTRHAELASRLAEALSIRGEPLRGDSVLEKAQSCLSEAANFELAAQVGLKLFDSKWGRGFGPEQLEGHLQETLDQARQVGGSVYASLLLRYSYLCKSSNHREVALRHYEEARDVFRSIGDHRGVAHAADNLGGVWRDLGRPDNAETHLRQALQIWEAVGDPTDIAFARFRLAWGLGSSSSAYHARRASEALALLADARKQYAEAENLGMMAECDMQAAMCIAADPERGSDEAIPFFERAATLFDAVGAEASLWKTQVNLATEHSRRGDIDRAMGIWESVAESAEEFGDDFFEGVTRILMVRQLLKRGYVDVGSRMLDDVAEVLETSDVKEWRAQYWLARAESFQRMNQLRPTKEAAAAALAELSETVLPEEYAAVLEVLAWCDDGDGKPDKAGRRRGEALALYTNIGESEDAHRLAAAIVPPPPKDAKEGPDLPPLSTGVYL